jgi:hypothetical protein
LQRWSLPFCNAALSLTLIKQNLQQSTIGQDSGVLDMRHADQVEFAKLRNQICKFRIPDIYKLDIEWEKLEGFCIYDFVFCMLKQYYFACWDKFCHQHLLFFVLG